MSPLRSHSRLPVIRRRLTLVSLLVLGLGSILVAAPPAVAAGSVSVVAWTCPSDLVADGMNPSALAAACAEPSVGTTFALSTGGVTRRRVTAAGQPAIWPAVAGEFQLSIDDPKGESALVVCDQSGVPTTYEGPQGMITGTLAEDADLHCNWYRLAQPAVPVPTSIVPTHAPSPPPASETSGSATTGDEAGTPPNDGSPASGDFSGPIDIGGRSLYLTCLGSGSRTMILEAGGPGGTSNRWAEIRTQMPPDFRVCSYDRAGLGQSDPAAAGTRTIQNSVNDLRALVTTAQLGCPCLMVGESWGANIVRLYAGQYPTDISGLVLIDPIPPGFLDTFLALVPPETPGYSNLMGSDNLEGMDQLASLRQADTATNPPPVPAVVITHGLQLGFPIGFPVDQLEATWRKGEEKLAQDLHAFLLIADRSSNSILRDQPDIVVEAIGTVAAAVADPAGARSTLVIRRIDANEVPLPGACYQIYLDAGNGEHGDYRGGACDIDIDGQENGRIVLVALEPGDYVVEEITTPKDVPKADDQRVTVVGSATYITIQSQTSDSSTPAN